MYTGSEYNGMWEWAARAAPGAAGRREVRGAATATLCILSCLLKT